MDAGVVVAHALEVVAIDEVGGIAPSVFTADERAYAESKSDPERRLAARLAAKRAAARALGGGVTLAEVEVRAGRGGPPTLRLLGAAPARLREVGGEFTRVSLTHGVQHAAASVLVLRAGEAGRVEPAPRLRPLALKLGALALLLLLPLAWVALSPFGDAETHPFNQDRNAVWLEHRWLERAHDERRMEDLLGTLRDRGVVYVYPHVIPFDREGKLPPHDREQMRRFLQVARRVAPEMKVLPWVGGLRVGWKRTRAGTLDLADLAQRQRIVAECRGLVDEGFHGVHLNIEPVDDGNDDLLALLRSLRTAVGDTNVLSISTIKPGPVHVWLAPNFFWTPEYYARVGELADQVVVMAYDTGIPTPSLYRRYLSYVASNVARSLGPRSRARVLVGVPTYDAAGIMHRAGVENPENALLGIVAGLRGLGAGGTFEGVALYAEWTTDEEEWEIYDRLWRRKTTPSPSAGTPPGADPPAPARTAPAGTPPAGRAAPATRP